MSVGFWDQGSFGFEIVCKVPDEAMDGIDDPYWERIPKEPTEATANVLPGGSSDAVQDAVPDTLVNSPDPVRRLFHTPEAEAKQKTPDLVPAPATPATGKSKTLSRSDSPDKSTKRSPEQKRGRSEQACDSGGIKKKCRRDRSESPSKRRSTRHRERSESPSKSRSRTHRERSESPSKSRSRTHRERSESPAVKSVRKKPRSQTPGKPSPSSTHGDASPVGTVDDTPSPGSATKKKRSSAEARSRSFR